MTAPRHWLGFAWGAALTAACTITNPFGEVREGASVGGAGSGGTSAFGGMAAMGGAGGSPMDSGPDAAGGVGGGEAPLPPGLVVVAGVGDGEAGRESVIAALDPRTGRELVRRRFGTQRSIRVVYDGATELWYVFEQQGTVTEAFTLHAWRFNRSSRDFEELGTLSVPAPKGAIVALNQRIYYQSVMQEQGSPPTEGFTLLKTEQPGAPEVLLPAQHAPTLGGTVFELVARPHEAAPGGDVHVYIKDTSCVGGPAGPLCDVRVRLASIGSSQSTAQFAATSQVLGQVLQSGGSAGATRAGEDDVIVLPDPDWLEGGLARWEGTATRFSPPGFTSQSSTLFGVDGPAIRDAAWDPCLGVVFATELAQDAALFAIPTAPSGVTFRLGFDSPPVAAVHFEPVTRTVIQPRDDAGSFSLRAFSVAGTEAAPTLEERLPSSALPWEPPADLRPVQVALEVPESVGCP